MESTHLAPRFRVLRWIQRSPDGVGLAEVRDAATGRIGWAVLPGERKDVGLEVALELRIRRLAALELAGVGELEPRVVRQDSGLLVLCTPLEGQPWEVRRRTWSEGEVREESVRLRAALDRWCASAIVVGPLELDQLWWTPRGPRLLPTAWMLPVVPPGGHTHAPAIDADRATRDLRALFDLTSEGVAVGAEDGADGPEDPTEVLHRVRADETWVVARSDDAWETARGLERAAAREGIPCLRIRPFGVLGAERPVGEGAPLLILEQVREFAEVTDPLYELQRRGWIDGTESLVVLNDQGAEDEVLRLYAASRFGREAPREISFDRVSARSAVADSFPDGEAGIVLELLEAAGRGLGVGVVATATGIAPDELAVVLDELLEQGWLRSSWGRAADAPELQYMVEAVAPAALRPQRRRELQGLLAAALPSRGRVSFSVLWLRAVTSAARDEPSEAARQWRALALRAQEKGRGLLALAAYRRLLELTAEATAEDRARAAICTSEQAQRAGDIEGAVAALLRPLDEAPDGRLELDAELEAELVLRLAQLEMHRSDFAAAEQRLSAMLARSKERLPTEVRARAYLELAWAQLQLGRTRESIRSSELTQGILDPLRHTDLVARAHNQIGFALYKESDYTGSIVHYERALRLREQVGDELGVARTHNNLALSHRALGQLHEAEQCLRESLRLKRAAGDELAVAASLLNLGFVQLDRRDATAAERSAVTCLDIARAHGHPETEAEAWGLRGEAAAMDGRDEAALEYLQRDLEICESTEHQAERLATLRRRAEVLLHLGRDAEAEEDLHRARQLLEAQPSRYETALLDRLEADLRRRAGEPEAAVELYGAGARGMAAVRRPQAQVGILAERGLLELELGRHERARATLAELRELVGRHELHEVPEGVTRLDRELLRAPVRSGPLGADACLDVLVEALADPAPSISASALVASSVVTALATAEARWIDAEGRCRRPDGERWVDEAVRPVLPFLESSAPVAEVRREGAWTAVALGEEAGGGWFAVRRDEALGAPEEQLLRGLARAWSRAPAPADDFPAPGPAEEPAAPSSSDPGPAVRLVGRSTALAEVLRDVKRVAATDVGVLVLGENGTGKELVAQAIHRASARRRGRFVAVNCASIPATLLESELFGHERGAFTSAHTRRLGRFELAHGGTLMLDEIGEMPLEMQAKILRVLQERSFTRLGGSETVRSDARVIAATNRDLEKEVERGRFRMDLYFRLNVVTLRVPPLRERPEDIEPLAEHFLRRHGPEYGARVTSVSPEALRALEAYSWPGNVRELENALKHALVFASGEMLRAEDLPASVLGSGDGPRERRLEGAVAGLVATEDYDEERPLGGRLDLLLAHEMVKRVGNKTRAARLLGITKPTLYDRLRRFEALYGDPGSDD